MWDAPVPDLFLLGELHIYNREELRQVLPHLTLLDKDVLTLERESHAHLSAV